MPVRHPAAGEEIPKALLDPWPEDFRVHPDNALVVAYPDQGIVAFALLFECGHGACFLAHYAVLPKYRGRHAAADLMRSCVAFARARDCTLLYGYAMRGRLLRRYKMAGATVGTETYRCVGFPVAAGEPEYGRPRR